MKKNCLLRKFLPSRHQSPVSRSNGTGKGILRILAVGLTLVDGIHNARAAAAFWTKSGSGNWEDGSNWSTAPLVPDNGNGGATYDVTISSSTRTFVVLSTDVTIDNFTLDIADALTLNGGTLNVQGTASLTRGVFEVWGNDDSSYTSAAISGGTWNVSNNALLTISGTTRLERAAINGAIHILDANPFPALPVMVDADTTFTTAHLEGVNAGLTFASSSQPFSGTILFSGAARGERTVSLSSIGAAGAIRTAADLSNGSYVSGSFDRYVNRVGGDNLVNNGMISSQTEFQTVSVDGSNFINCGNLQAINGGILNLTGTWANEGTISVGANSTLNLGGTFNTAGGSGTFNNTAGGNVIITGTVLNTGNTITLNSSTGSWTMSGGTIQGGALNLTDGSNLYLDSNDLNFLNGVAVTGDGLRLESGGRARIGGGATFTSAHLAGSYSALGFAPGQTVTGTIWLEGGAFGGRNVAMDGHDGTLTIGASGAIRTGADLRPSYENPFGDDPSDRIGGTAPPTGSPSEFPGWTGTPYGGNMTLINEGLISAETANTTLKISAVNLTNNGTLQAANKGVLKILTNQWTNTGAIQASNGGTVDISFGTRSQSLWRNAGTITLDATSSVKLGGTFDATGGIGTFHNTAGGKVYITGTMLNTGNTLTLNADTGSWRLSGGTIQGGIVNCADGQSLRVTDIPDNFLNYSNLLSGVTVNGDIHIDVISGVGIVNGTTFHTVHMSGGSSLLSFGAGGSLTSTVLFEGEDSDYRSIHVNGAFTVSSSGVIRTTPDLNNPYTGNYIGTKMGSAGEDGRGGPMSLVNQGLISSETSGQTITISASSLANSGTLRAVDGGILTIIPTNFTNTGTLQTLNGGILNIGSGTVSGTPAGGGINLTALGKLSLQGGQLSTPNLTNRGEISGFGTITNRPVNHGTIRSSGGALVFSNGIQGGSGTVQIDAGSSLDLSAGTSNSNGDYLIHNGNTPGSLNLGANNFTVAVDYTNASTGSGNSYNPRANVSGTGQILAGGNVTQRLTGAVTEGTTATPQLDFGNIHTGTSKTLNYQIANGGTFGPSLRGAVQTAAGGADISDSRLTGTGVTAGNFGPVAKGANGGNLAVTFTGSTAGALTGQTFGVVGNFGNVASQTVSVTGAAYRYASPSLTSGTSLDFGIVHVGDTVSQAVPVTNSAVNDGFSESLNASFTGSTPGIITGGAFANLAPGSSSSALTIGLDTSTARIVAGTSTLGLVSDGAGSSGLGQTVIPDQILNLTGQVNNYAAPVFLKLSGGGTLVQNSANVFTLDFGTIGTIGNSGMETAPVVTLGLMNDVSGPSDTLAGNFLTDTGIFTASGLDPVTGLTAGQIQSGLTLSLDNAETGIFTGSITFNASSQNASGYDGSLGTFVVNLQANVVPEPSGSALLILAAAGLFRRRTGRPM